MKVPHKKFGPDRFSRFDVYRIQTDKQTNKTKYILIIYIDASMTVIDRLQAFKQKICKNPRRNLHFKANSVLKIYSTFHSSLNLCAILSTFFVKRKLIKC